MNQTLVVLFSLLIGGNALPDNGRTSPQDPAGSERPSRISEARRDDPPALLDLAGAEASYLDRRRSSQGSRFTATAGHPPL